MSNLSDTPIYLCVRDIRPLSSPAKRGVNSTPWILSRFLPSYPFSSFLSTRTERTNVSNLLRPHFRQERDSELDGNSVFNGSR